jgi:hypothetical protein
MVKNQITRRLTMTLRTGVFATIVLLLGSASAFAQAVPVPVPVPYTFVEYSAKFLCGVVDAREPVAGARPGVYETSINIHNPQLPFVTPLPSVTFFKKVVLALREGEEPSPPSWFHIDSLKADYADRVDCRVIRAILNQPVPAPFIEGFVVLLLVSPPGTLPQELDVVGVYTVDTQQQQPSISLEVVPITHRVLTLPGPIGRKLHDEMLEQSKKPE